jgi:hypothetical protein
VDVPMPYMFLAKTVLPYCYKATVMTQNLLAWPNIWYFSLLNALLAVN